MWPLDTAVLWLPACRAISCIHGLRELHIAICDASKMWKKGGAKLTYARFLDTLVGFGCTRISRLDVWKV